MDDKKKIVLVGAVLGVVAAIGVVMLVISYRGPSCELMAFAPQARGQLADMKKVASSDNKALAAFDGYLQYALIAQKAPVLSRSASAAALTGADADPTPAPAPQPKAVYMGLELASITVTALDKGAQQVKLATNCSTLTLSLASPNKVESMQLDLVLANDKYTSCKVSVLNMDFAPDTHYECNAQRTYSCYDLKEPKVLVASIYLNAFAFEINGDAAKIKEGQFSTKASVCKA